MKKVSIIVPCYNVSETIDCCMNALISQTIGIESLEIILVNDASTDNTLDILCRWENNYPESVLVVDCEENGGPGQARNIGIQYASAPYIGFADDDDICAPTMFEVLYHAAVSHNCDLIICQSVAQNEHFKPLNSEPQKSDELLVFQSPKERLAFLERDTNFAVWNKLYSKDLLIDNQILFPAGIFYEDILFSTIVKLYCNKVYISQKILYHHITNATSISNNNLPERRLNFLEVNMLLIEEVRQRNLYSAFSGWFDEQFIVKYLSFILNYEDLFGEMDPALFSIIKENIWSLFPELTKIPLVQMLLEDTSNASLHRWIQKLIE